jgi:hypothetical protein
MTPIDARMIGLEENAAFLGTRRVENRLQRKIEREGKIVAIGYSGL